MKVRNKIFLSILSIVFLLVVFTYIMNTRITHERILANFAEDLIGNYYTVSVFYELRNEDSIKGSLVISASPRLKAVAELGDSVTARQLMTEIFKGLGADIFMLTDSDGNPLVELYSSTQTGIQIHSAGTVKKALDHTPASSVVRSDNSIYRIATAPVSIGTDILGTITIGFQLTKDEIVQMEQMTNSIILLAADNRTVVGTEHSHLTGIVEEILDSDARQISEFEIGGNRYLGVPFFLADNTAYIIVKSVQNELDAALSPLRKTLLLISILVLCSAALTGSALSRSIGRPIEKLVEGTREISMGRYGYLSNINTKDELGVLSRKFDEMSVSLKEKINELDALNIDLKDQNEKLERAFRQLRETQEELVKSERLAATGKISAQLSHEINNPIHNIQSCLETALERAPNDGGNRQLIEIALEEVVRMSRLTREMLDFYRRSVTNESFVKADLTQIVVHTLSISRETLEKKKIICETDFTDSPLSVYCSPEKLKQVFFNLILNAKDSMSEGGRLFIGTVNDGGSAQAVFRDTGTGIPRESLDKIFDAFYTTKGDVKGVGLGLSVSYGIIKQHAGKIEVMSRPGKGSVFTVSLPINKKDA